MIPHSSAGSMYCPFARTFAVKEAKEGCRGVACALWRFEKINAGHPLWKKAIAAEVAKTGEKAPYSKAARAIADDPEAHGLVSDRGYCGAGGAP